MSFSVLEGTLQPWATFVLESSFEAAQPVILTKKTIKIEVTDSLNLLGIVQSIPISVVAEAYNVAVELHFPKGSTGNLLNFGLLRVFEESKQTLVLKNKGKYALKYAFVAQHPHLWHISPSEGKIC